MARGHRISNHSDPADTFQIQSARLLQSSRFVTASMVSQCVISVLLGEFGPKSVVWPAHPGKRLNIGRYVLHTAESYCFLLNLDIRDEKNIHRLEDASLDNKLSWDHHDTHRKLVCKDDSNLGYGQG